LLCESKYLKISVQFFRKCLNIYSKNIIRKKIFDGEIILSYFSYVKINK
jgi:hypothetical protein